MASEWTAAILGAVIVVVHVLWFRSSARQGEVLSGLGGALTTLGIFVAAQPYIRKGLQQAGREQAGTEDSRGDHTEALRHVVKERVVGVALLAAGSLLNGYGPAIANVLNLRGS